MSINLNNNDSMNRPFVKKNQEITNPLRTF